MEGGIDAIFATVELTIIGCRANHLRIALHDLVNSFHVLFLFSCWQSVHFSVPLVQNFLQVTLSLKIKLLNVLSIIDRLGINFLVTNQDSFPNLLLHLFQIDIQIFTIFHVPE